MTSMRGAALVAAMLVAALAAAVVAAIASAQSQWQRSVELRRDQVQAQALVLAGLTWARQLVQLDTRGGSVDHLGEPWALPLPPTPLENGSIEGGMTCNTLRSIQLGANAAREKTYPCALSTYGRRNAQARSVHSFDPSKPTWHRQTTRAPSSTSGAIRPAGCGSWTKTTSPLRTVPSTRWRFSAEIRS